MGEPWFPWDDPYRTDETPGRGGFRFLAGAPGAPSQEEIGALWARYMSAYLQELEESEGGG